MCKQQTYNVQTILKNKEGRLTDKLQYCICPTQIPHDVAWQNPKIL